MLLRNQAKHEPPGIDSEQRLEIKEQFFSCCCRYLPQSDHDELYYNRYDFIEGEYEHSQPRQAEPGGIGERQFAHVKRLSHIVVLELKLCPTVDEHTYLLCHDLIEERYGMKGTGKEIIRTMYGDDVYRNVMAHTMPDSGPGIPTEPYMRDALYEQIMGASLFVKLGYCVDTLDSSRTYRCLSRDQRSRKRSRILCQCFPLIEKEIGRQWPEAAKILKRKFEEVLSKLRC